MPSFAEYHCSGLHDFASIYQKMAMFNSLNGTDQQWPESDDDDDDSYTPSCYINKLTVQPPPPSKKPRYRVGVKKPKVGKDQPQP